MKLKLDTAIKELIAAAQSCNHPQGQYGTKESGLARPPKGLKFCCRDCQHYSDQRCCHPKVVADPEVAKQDGKAVVEPEECCSWWYPKSG